MSVNWEFDRFGDGKASKPDHHELVKIRCRDRKKLEPFQQRNRFQKRAIQDATVERKPTGFSREVLVLFLFHQIGDVRMTGFPKILSNSPLAWRSSSFSRRQIKSCIRDDLNFMRKDFAFQRANLLTLRGVQRNCQTQQRCQLGYGNSLIAA